MQCFSNPHVPCFLKSQVFLSGKFALIQRRMVKRMRAKTAEDFEVCLKEDLRRETK